VVGGSIAKELLSGQNIAVTAWVEQIGNVTMKKRTTIPKRTEVYGHLLRCPDYQAADKMVDLIASVKKEGDTLGGVVAVGIKGVPPGWGEPVFDKLHAAFGQALLSIPSVKGVAFGSGFDGVAMRGSEHNDPFIIKENKISTQTNYSGGIQGGLSNGEDIYIRIAFKPVSSIAKQQKSVDKSMNTVDVDLSSGRHDVCVVPRVLPIVEAMISLVLADMYLRNKSVT
jgi:chorismate synthase